HYCCAWNFGPYAGDEATVGQVAHTLAELWGESAHVSNQIVDNQPHEAGLLRLDATRASAELGWRPRWSIEQALQATVSWHQAWLAQKPMDSYSLEQIQQYLNADTPPSYS
ncbi:MAG: CDP-glucose 4,6-dehydratase, partial [Cyanobacteria bacterium P01_H01_bin.121]